jgi:hypothetical protein
MNRSTRRLLVLGLVLLALVAAGSLLVDECAYGGGMGAAYRTCSCLGLERQLYDRTAADGPRRTICAGLVRSRTCYQFQGGPQVPCE